MSEAFDYEKLAAAIKQAMAPRAPIMPAEMRLWDVAAIAEYLSMSEDQVRNRIVCHPDFPKSVRLPTVNGRNDGAMSQRRWKAKEVMAFAEKR